MSITRVSSISSHMRALGDIRTAREQFETLQNQVVSGKNFKNAKEDPLGAQQVMRLDTQLSKQNQFLRNITHSKGVLEVTSNTLQTIEDILLEIKITAENVAGEVFTSAERSVAGDDINILLDGLVNIANTKHLGRFIFGGVNTLSGSGATPSPFNTTKDASGFITAVTPNADGIDTVYTREVRDGLDFAINLSGSAPFMPNGATNSGDIFQVIIDLRDDLLNNTTGDLAADINALQNALDQVVEQDVKVGARQNQLDIYETQQDFGKVQLQGEKSFIEEVDFAEILILYEQAQATLSATLQTSSQLLQISLLNFL